MINKKDLDRLNSISDEQLQNSIQQIASSAGFDTSALNSVLSDLPSIRKAASHVSQKELDKLVEYIGQENAGKLADILKNNPQEK